MGLGGKNAASELTSHWCSNFIMTSPKQSIQLQHLCKSILMNITNNVKYETTVLEEEKKMYLLYLYAFGCSDAPWTMNPALLHNQQYNSVVLHR